MKQETAEDMLDFAKEVCQKYSRVKTLAEETQVQWRQDLEMAADSKYPGEKEKPYGKQNTRRIQTMTNKAKTYLKNIQGADTEKKLIGIEIAFKQDMTLSCNDLGSLCRAAEDKRYSLRNNEETLKLKQILFFRTKAEMDAYHDMSRKPEGWTEAEIEQQRSRFCSIWQVIEEAELVDEYEAWKEANPNA